VPTKTAPVVEAARAAQAERMRRRLAQLGADPASPFPPLGDALDEPNGLLAVGGDLCPARLLAAYRHGVFPWFSEGQPILWWSPDPRVVFDTAAFRLPRKLRARLAASPWTLRADTAFEAVIDACATSPRPGQDGTWIGPSMRAAYVALHRLGHAHSVEVFDGEVLAGGIYGVAVGRMFFGESMFSARSNGSRLALAGLCRLLADRDWPLLDAQVDNPHLRRLGAREMPRRAFAEALSGLVDQPGEVGSWRDAMGHRPVAWLASPAPR
jgi:leucyl/phenylalanyl-tRNA--protein transferase